MNNKPSVCVDLDGTLAYYTSWKSMEGRIGKPRPGAREFLENLWKETKVIIFTARLSEDYNNSYTCEMIKTWLDEHNMMWDEIYIGRGKPVCEAFVDDRAVAIPKNPIETDFDKALDKVRRFLEI